MNELETTFFYLAIGMAILLPFSLLKFAFRERIAQELIKTQGREKLLRFIPSYVWFLRMGTWVSLLCLAAFPPALNLYHEAGFSIVFICMALMFATLFFEYRFRKWQYQYLIKLEN